MRKIPYQYKEVPGYPGYYVTINGTMRNQHTKLKPSVHRKGHLYHVVRIALGSTTQQTRLYVHRAVMLAFGPPNAHKLPLIRHLDGNPRNNRLSNLAWGTHAENARDREMHKRERRSLQGVTRSY